MKNIRSTVAMKLAHKIAKALPKASFSTCLRYAWKQVRIDLSIAKRLLSGDYKISVKTRNITFGKARDIVFYAKGLKNSVKRFFGKTDDYMLSLWAGW